MAEAEDVITDAALHATAFMQGLWRRHRRPGPRHLQLADVQARLDLLAHAVCGRHFRLRPAQAPAPRTWLDRLVRRHEAAPAAFALPATDGTSIWLPPTFGIAEPVDDALERYRVLLLQQALRAMRGSAAHFPAAQPPLVRALYHLLEARAADAELAARLPGMRPALQRLRQRALAARPAAHAQAPDVQAVERLVQAVLRDAADEALASCPLPATPAAVLLQAHALAATLPPGRGRVLHPDLWLGEFRLPATAGAAADGEHQASDRHVRSGRLARRPDRRQTVENEDAPATPGPAMVQTAQPHEAAEDPFGMERPADRDTDTAADDFADALSDLPQARLVRRPGPPPEVLLSDDTPEGAANAVGQAQAGTTAGIRYPEWDWRSGSYAEAGATVFVTPAASGTQATVDAILQRHGVTLHAVRRRFELLRAQRLRLRRQLDGDDVDLQAWIDSRALLRAGGPAEQRLYLSERRGRRDMAVTLLVDISGSTDGWISGGCRVIDVERDALLLVCVALDGLNEPFSVLGFSGEGPHGVVVRTIKDFDECYGAQVALRVAGLEPERFTRAGAAVRHAARALMARPAAHRLLIVLSDGRPNDVDQYDGRYGVEDLRQAVTEARLQGIAPFCLTIDRQAAGYLPAVFGPHGYALLPRAALLPEALLGWLQKLVVS